MPDQSSLVDTERLLLTPDLSQKRPRLIFLVAFFEDLHQFLAAQLRQVQAKIQQLPPHMFDPIFQLLSTLLHGWQSHAA